MYTIIDCFDCNFDLPSHETSTSEPRHDKTNKMSVRPPKTKISLGIRCAQWVAKDQSFLHMDSEDWSDWADAQADLSLRWAHTHFAGFVMLRLKYADSISASLLYAA